MSDLFQLARKSPFVRNVAVLVSGTSIAQALIVLASPILSRLYDPDAFGTLAVIIGLAAPLAQMGSLKYDHAIVMVKRSEEAANLAILSLGLLISIALITAAAILGARDWIAEALDSPGAAPLLLFVPGFVLVVGLSNVLIAWANRERSYRSIAAADLSRSASMLLVQISLGALAVGAKGLAAGRLVGQFVGALVLAIRQRRQWAIIFKDFKPELLKGVAREHSQFPIYTMPRELLVSLSTSATPIVIAFFFSPAAAGLYWFAVRLLEAPKTLISVAVRRVFYEAAANLHHDKEPVLPLLKNTTVFLVALAALPTALIVAFGPDLFDVIFGSDWRRAGVYAQWLILWWMSSFSVVAATSLVPILRIQRGVLIIEVVGLVLRMSGLVGGLVLMSDVLAIALFSVAGFLVNLFRMAYVFHHAMKQQQET